MLFEKGYTSTSLCDFSNIGLIGRNGYITFNIPKGYTGALYIKDLSYDKFRSQEEVLFDIGIKYIINGIEEKNGIYYIDAEVLNDA